MKNRFLKHYYSLKFSSFFFFNNLYLLIFSNNISFYLSKIFNLKFIYCKRYQFFFNLKKFFNFYSLINLGGYLRNILYTAPFIFILFFNVEFFNLINILKRFKMFCLKKFIYFLVVLYENFLIYSYIFSQIFNHFDSNLFFFIKRSLFKLVFLFKINLSLAEIA